MKLVLRRNVRHSDDDDDDDSLMLPLCPPFILSPSPHRASMEMDLPLKP